MRTNSENYTHKVTNYCNFKAHYCFNYIYSLIVFKTQQSYSFTNVLVVKVENHKRDFDVFDNHPL